ncbi:DUF3182 family protein [Imbroritus primus]|uniref:DUF3182 family protein n=1 Tax=Imbroritus primus TaxID=3058603 RepID=UPI0026D0060D
MRDRLPGHGLGLPVVMPYRPDACAAASHEIATHQRIAQKVAQLLGRRLQDPPEDLVQWRAAYGAAGGSPYYVPFDTLEVAVATALGIHGVPDLFGGVVPQAFVATKVITHPVWSPDAAAPAGWCRTMGGLIEDVVLPGYSAFAVADARRAGRLLLREGRGRVKAPMDKGGLGQQVIRDAHALDACLVPLEDTLATTGVVLERDMDHVRTCSVGQIILDGVCLSYHGTQCLTPDNTGGMVYGGSSLQVVRGDFDAVLRLPLDPQTRRAVVQACRYHQTAQECYPGLYASRCNYDVLQGETAGGVWQSGVLEQSWRVGGATGAELAAFAYLREHPEVGQVRAVTCEIYGRAAASTPVPRDAVIYFDGDDGSVGPLLKYARVETDAGP